MAEDNLLQVEKRMLHKGEKRCWMKRKPKAEVDKPPPYEKR
jgi:hypothetical protein